MDFSHHCKLCNKTQHVQLYKNKSILKLVAWFCSSRALKHVCKCKHRRNSSLWWEVPNGKVSALASAQEPSAQDHTEYVQWAPAPAEPTSNAKKKALFSHYEIFSTLNGFTWNESGVFSWVTGDWFITDSMACSLPSQSSAPCRNTAATNVDRVALLNWTPSTQNNSWGALYLHARVVFAFSQTIKDISVTKLSAYWGVHKDY